jgi:hypothetical protein
LQFQRFKPNQNYDEPLSNFAFNVRRYTAGLKGFVTAVAINTKVEPGRCCSPHYTRTTLSIESSFLELNHTP